ncbi:ATP-binding cassette domain-containing protein [Leptolyngbya sp. FACHB-671]|uniref:ATP-binding cassette domain-containing protein n=1 Tax=Leptolyngbya sp. FACHB-671 TaxID=2692812 RepID=UPI001685FE93|nr:ATP-binding cassette domain-containing protein [Leptolyngbya sp. FACHB-671]
MISIRDLYKIYTYQRGEGKITALDGISLEVKAGEVFGVLGQSGAGKSTLIRCVNCLEKPTSGSVWVGDEEITALSGARLRRARQRIGMIFQHFNLLSSRTAAENIAFPLELISYSRLKRRTRVEELLSLVGLEGRGGAYPAQLSGGQKQRVGIARALAANPNVLLCDEATSALDPQTTRSILELLRDLNRHMGLTILLITHEMGVVKQICDRVAILEAGKVIEQGTVSELAAQPDSFIARELFPQRNGFKSRPGSVLVTIAFRGETANQPLISDLAKRFDVDVNIISGTVDTVGGQRVGQLHVELSGKDVRSALDYLQVQDLRHEVH